MAVMTIITSVVTAFLLVIVLDGWPFSLIPNKLLGGIVLLVSAYLLNAAVLRAFFNFSFAAEAPWYRADLDPAGLFNAWDVVAVMVTAAAIMFAFLLLDTWPLSRISALRGSPAFGTAWLVSCLALGWIALGVHLPDRYAVTDLPGPCTDPVPFTATSSDCGHSRVTTGRPNVRRKAAQWRHRTLLALAKLARLEAG